MSAILLSTIPVRVRSIVAGYMGAIRPADDDIAEWETVGCLARSVERLKGLAA